MHIIVSACLLGVDCKYNGSNNLNETVLEMANQDIFIPICPEQLGGLSTPREPAEIINGEGNEVLSGIALVRNKKGEDVTKPFLKGAEETLKIARLYHCKKAILKANSPSCGCGSIYDGTFSGQLKKGNGICAQMLINDGIQVLTEKDL